MDKHARVVVADEVADALGNGRGVVALESTLLAHGMPLNRRVEVAHALEQAVRQEGAVPAVIAVVDGAVRVGIDPATLERLCTGDHVSKCAERDLAVALCKGGIHATTVSSTMWAAAQAGIHVFATGGIGGVHRGVESTMDESQDLVALSRHPVAVISAGAKAILDLPRTLERLETLNVLVLGWRCSEFPGFYTPHTGLPLEHRVDEMNLLSAIVRMRLADLRQGGVLVCNPVPAEHAMPVEEVNTSIHTALEQADQQGVRGKALTPFLLAAMERVTGGQSVETNLALAMNNARVGAQLARELARP